MIVMIFHKVRPSVRGELSRWLIELRPGVLVGHASARVRDLLWAKVCRQIEQKSGGALLLHPADNEQGYVIKSTGVTPLRMLDFDGVTLSCSPRELRRKRSKAKAQPDPVPHPAQSPPLNPGGS